MVTGNDSAKEGNEERTNSSGNHDLEKAGTTPRIVWDDVDHRERGRLHGKSTRRGSRSQSRDSISSIRSRTQSVSGIPVGFRTLSIQVNETKAKAGDPPSKHTDSEDKDFFGQLDYHTLSAEEQGLTQEASLTRLQRDGKNDIPSPPEHMWRKLFWYVFGGFCSILWIGVIICTYHQLLCPARNLHVRQQY
jgi:sodium/potassium-transporting ATPase subunit alpha